MAAEGFVKGEDGRFEVPPDKKLLMRIPSELVPKCPADGSDVMMNLRADDRFVQDDGWYVASAGYADFLRRHEGMRVLFLELGVGANTPVIIKYPFGERTAADPDAVYACINYGQAFCPAELADRSILINGDIGEVLERLLY